MKLRTITAGICISLLATSTGFAEDKPEFSYSGKHGPEHWGSLSPAWSACAEGKSQSPINVASAVDQDLPALSTAYEPGAKNFTNNGHAVQVNYDAGSTLTIGDSGPYELKQFHFHSPSEHQRDGKNLHAEMHLVHADADGNLAVIGVLIDEGHHNAKIAELWNDIPGFRGTTNDVPRINVADLLPEDDAHFAYSGSLTTPPCSEGVSWIIMEQPLTMSIDQVMALKNAIGFENNRPVQALNGRTVAK
ncbi:MAG: carbonic anhydrase family protein [Xanthomonadales bacterium]|nr:carbonic anhydrase family protein [Xanthomonadales bacterium]